jgi:hypothetical protein
VNYLHIQYKRETGKTPTPHVDERDLKFYRSKGRWILDENLSDNVAIIRSSRGEFQIFADIPDEDYISWLEQKVEELQRNQKV